VGTQIAEAKDVDLGGLGEHFRRAGSQAPRVLDRQRWHHDRIRPLTQRVDEKRIAAAYTIHGWTTWVVVVPYAGPAVVLVAHFEASIDGCIQLMNDCFYRRKDIVITLDGPTAERPLVDGITQRLRRRGESLGALELDLDAHQLLLPNDGRDFSAPTRFPDFDRVRRVVFRGEPARADWGPPRLPVEANRPPGALVALDESITIAVATDEPIAQGFLYSVAQTVCGLARCREIRRQAYSALAEAARVDTSPTLDVATARARLTELSNGLSSLEIDLSFGVQGNADIGAVLPVNQVAGYHRELVDATGLNSAALVSVDLLERLSRSINAARDAAGGEERSRAERFQRRLAIVGAALVAPSLATGIYGANLEGFPVKGDAAVIGWLAVSMVVAVVLTLLGVFLPSRHKAKRSD
jgi:hypothetical protein